MEIHEFSVRSPDDSKILKEIVLQIMEKGERKKITFYKTITITTTHKTFIGLATSCFTYKAEI